jgi:hypothetical protein
MTRARAALRLSRLAFVAVLVSVSSHSTVARADEPLAPEIDANPSNLPQPAARTNLVLVGAAVTVGWYGAAFGMSYLWPDSNGATSLRIPVAGPYLALGKSGCGDHESGCTTFTLVARAVLTTLSAVGQTGGVLVLLEGAFLPTGVAAAPPLTRNRNVGERPFSRVAIVPAPVGPSGLGIGVLGEF